MQASLDHDALFIFLNVYTLSYAQCNYRPPAKSEEGNVCTGVCQSVHGEGGIYGHVLSGTRSLLGGGGYVRGLWDLRGGGYSPPRTSDTMGYGRQAGGTHPTGMLSCYILCETLNS